MDWRTYLLGGLSIVGACGDDEASGSDGSTQTSAASQTPTDASSSSEATSVTASTSASVTSDASGGSSSAAESSSTGEHPFDLPCGDALVCTGGDVCIEDVFDPECTNLDPGGMCPDGQSMTNCGGDGHPCCCLPPPVPEFRCVTPTGCEGPVDCACLGVALCTDGRACMSQGADPEHLFRCESLPKP